MGVTTILTFRAMDAVSSCQAHQNAEPAIRNTGATTQGRKITLRLMFAVLFAALGCISHAQAQPYPSRPVTMIVPFPREASPTSSRAWSARR